MSGPSVSDHSVGTRAPHRQSRRHFRTPGTARTALLAIGAIGSLAIVGVPSAALAYDPPNPDTLQALSSDQSAATGTVKVTWYAKDAFKVDWTNTDNRADGRGPILFINEVRKDAGSYLGKNIVYNHNFDGTPFSTNGSKSVDENATSDLQYVIEVRVKECNGGSQSAPENCSGWVESDNYYYH